MVNLKNIGLIFQRSRPPWPLRSTWGENATFLNKKNQFLVLATELLDRYIIRTSRMVSMSMNPNINIYSFI